MATHGWFYGPEDNKQWIPFDFQEYDEDVSQGANQQYPSYQSPSANQGYSPYQGQQQQQQALQPWYTSNITSGTGRESFPEVRDPSYGSFQPEYNWITGDYSKKTEFQSLYPDLIKRMVDRDRFPEKYTDPNFYSQIGGGYGWAPSSGYPGGGGVDANTPTPNEVIPWLDDIYGGLTTGFEAAGQGFGNVMSGFGGVNRSIGNLYGNIFENMSELGTDVGGGFGNMQSWLGGMENRLGGIYNPQFLDLAEGLGSLGGYFGQSIGDPGRETGLYGMEGFGGLEQLIGGYPDQFQRMLTQGLGESGGVGGVGATGLYGPQGFGGLYGQQGFGGLYGQQGFGGLYGSEGFGGLETLLGDEFRNIGRDLFGNPLNPLDSGFRGDMLSEFSGLGTQVGGLESNLLKLIGEYGPSGLSTGMYGNQGFGGLGSQLTNLDTLLRGPQGFGGLEALLSGPQGFEGMTSGLQSLRNLIGEAGPPGAPSSFSTGMYGDQGFGGLGNQLTGGFDRMGTDITGLGAQFGTDFNALNLALFGDGYAQRGLGGDLQSGIGGLGSRFGDLEQFLKGSQGLPGISSELGNLIGSVDGSGYGATGLYGSQGFGGLGSQMGTGFRDLESLMGGMPGQFQNLLGEYSPSGFSTGLYGPQGFGGLASQLTGGFGGISDEFTTLAQNIQNWGSGGQGGGGTQDLGNLRSLIEGLPAQVQTSLSSLLGNQAGPSGFGATGLYGDQGFGGLERLLGGMPGQFQEQMSPEFAGLRSLIGNQAGPQGLGTGLYGAQGFGGLQSQLRGMPGQFQEMLDQDLGNLIGSMGGAGGIGATGLYGQRGFGGLSTRMGGLETTLDTGFRNFLDAQSAYGNQAGNRFTDLERLLGDEGLGGRFTGLENLFGFDPEQGLQGQFAGLGTLLGESQNALGTALGTAFSRLEGEEGLGGRFTGLETLLGNQGTQFQTDFDRLMGSITGEQGLGEQFETRFGELEDLLFGETGFGKAVGGGTNINNYLYDPFADPYDPFAGFTDDSFPGRFGEMETDLESLLEQMQQFDEIDARFASLPGEFKNVLTQYFEEGAGGASDQTSIMSYDPFAGFTDEQLAAMGLDTPMAAGLVNPKTGTDMSPSAFFEGMQFDRPNLEFDPINDYSQLLSDPLINQTLARLDAPNPYDQRLEQITSGQESIINNKWDDAVERFISNAGLGDDFGSPKFQAGLIELEESRARELGQIHSTFGLEAARLEEPMQRGRLTDLQSVLGGEQARVGTELQRQQSMQAAANQQYREFLQDYQQAYYLPQIMRDEGTRMMLGGIGSTLNPSAGIGAAVTGLGNVAGAGFRDDQAEIANYTSIFNSLLDAFKKA